MIYKFSVKSNIYYFDGENLQLYKEFISEQNEKTALRWEKEEKVLNKAILMVANACNGKCIYCYEDHGTFGRKNALMEKDTADKIIAYICERYIRVRKIAFFGGEPTLNYPIIKYVVEKLKGKVQVDSYEITSNAVLMTEEMISLFKENNFKVIISLDGPAEIHNNLRIGCSHLKVVQIIDCLKKNIPNDMIELNCTLTNYHLNKMNRDELLDYFQQFNLKYHISDVITDIKELKLEEMSEKLKIDQSMEELYNYPLKRSINPYVKSIIEALVEHIVKESFCYDLEEKGQLTFDYDGRIFPCVNFIENAATKSINETSEVNEKIEEKRIICCNRKTNKACKECWARWVCTDCIAPYVQKKKIAPYLEAECYKRELYEYTLEKIVYYYDNDIEKFQKIIDNYYEFK